MKSFWLVSTDHLEKQLWFRDEEDFKVGMNLVAVQAHIGTAVVLSFILMSNHVHFVLKGSRNEALAFITGYKKRYSQYYGNKYGIKELLRRNNVDLQFIPLSDEAPEWAIAYVLMNCVAANICSHPSQYSWGAGNLFFNAAKPIGKPLGSMSARALKRLLHSDCSTLPREWLISEAGYILPGSYVDIKTVEACYRSAKRMNYFLSNSSKAKKRIEAADEHLPAFRDQTILTALPDLCQSLFGKPSFSALPEKDRTELVRQIRFRFSANVNQVARVCGISYEEAAKRMDSV